METIQFGIPQNYESGRYASISTNNNKVVELHCSHDSDLLWYRVGHFNKGEVKWGNNLHFSSGLKPSVAMNNYGEVVVVSEVNDLGQGFLDICVGTLEGKSVDWKNNTCYEAGYNPEVSINDEGLVVAVYESGDIESDRLHYSVGQLKGDEVEWLSLTNKKLVGKGNNPSVTLNNDGVVLFSYDYKGVIYYQVGKVFEGMIDWCNTPKKMQKGIQASVSLSNNGNVVVAYQSKNSTQLWEVSGIIGDRGEIVWGKPSKGEKGVYPKISIASDDAYALQVYTGEKQMLWNKVFSVVAESLSEDLMMYVKNLPAESTAFLSWQLNLSRSIA